MTATHGTKTFLDRKQLVPVAAAEMFVGRRHGAAAGAARRCGTASGPGCCCTGRDGWASRAWRRGSPTGCRSTHGGGLRRLQRAGHPRRGGRGGADQPDARDLIESRLAEVRQRPEAIEAVLIDLLTGPSPRPATTGSGRCCWSSMTWSRSWYPTRPARTGSRGAGAGDRRGAAGVRPGGDRQPPAGHQPVHVHPRRAARPGSTTCNCGRCRGGPAKAADGGSRRSHPRTPGRTRPNSPTRAVAVSRGNPGLQDLIGLRLVYGEQVGAERAEAAVAGMEDYLREVTCPPSRGAGVPREPGPRRAAGRGRAVERRAAARRHARSTCPYRKR